METRIIYFMEKCCTDQKVMTFLSFYADLYLLFVLGTNMGNVFVRICSTSVWIFDFNFYVRLLSGFSISIFPLNFIKILAPVAKQ